MIEVLLFAAAQFVNVCSINLELCNSTWSTDSEWQLNERGDNRWT